MNGHAENISHKGSEHFSRMTLVFYDLTVLLLNNHLFWRCPTRTVRKMFARLATTDHCDIGIGSGYYLKQQHRYRAFSNLNLIDANADTISWVEAKFPDVTVTSQCADVSQGLSAHHGTIGSISLVGLLHCMRGPLSRKELLLAGLKSLCPAGTPVFGATIVTDEKHQTWLSHKLLRTLNRNGVFDTFDDTQAGLEALLGRHLDSLKITMCGSVLLFEGTVAQ